MEPSFKNPNCVLWQYKQDKLINDFPNKMYFKHKNVLNEYRAIYNTYNISFCYIPLLPPLRNALKHYLYSYLVTRWLSFIFNIFINKIIHLRLIKTAN